MANTMTVRAGVPVLSDVVVSEGADLDLALDRVYGWANGEKACDMPDCPTTEGRYCLDCHSAAVNALAAVRGQFCKVLAYTPWRFV